MRNNCPIEWWKPGGKHRTVQQGGSGGSGYNTGNRSPPPCQESSADPAGSRTTSSTSVFLRVLDNFYCSPDIPLERHQITSHNKLWCQGRCEPSSAGDHGAEHCLGMTNAVRHEGSSSNSEVHWGVSGMARRWPHIPVLQDWRVFSEPVETGTPVNELKLWNSQMTTRYVLDPAWTWWRMALQLCWMEIGRFRGWSSIHLVHEWRPMWTRCWHELDHHWNHSWLCGRANHPHWCHWVVILQEVWIQSGGYQYFRIPKKTIIRLVFAWSYKYEDCSFKNNSLKYVVTSHFYFYRHTASARLRYI